MKQTRRLEPAVSGPYNGCTPSATRIPEDHDRRDRLVNTFCEIVQIDSPSGEEEEMAVDAVRRLERLGLSVVRDEYGNVIAGDEGRDPLLMSAHLDTVEPGRGIKPRVENDRITSDGTTILGGDCKAGVAAILEALQSLREDGADRRPVQVALTREEEIGLFGARNLDLSRIRANRSHRIRRRGPGEQDHLGEPHLYRVPAERHRQGRSRRSGA